MVGLDWGEFVKRGWFERGDIDGLMSVALNGMNVLPTDDRSRERWVGGIFLSG